MGKQKNPQQSIAAAVGILVVLWFLGAFKSTPKMQEFEPGDPMTDPYTYAEQYLEKNLHVVGEQFVDGFSGSGVPVYLQGTVENTGTKDLSSIRVKWEMEFVELTGPGRFKNGEVTIDDIESGASYDIREAVLEVNFNGVESTKYKYNVYISGAEF